MTRQIDRITKNEGGAPVRSTNFNYEVAEGLREGFSTWNKFGYNLDVDSASIEVIASFGGTYSYMTTADTLDVVSTSGDDTNGGTGVNSVIIWGVDENRDEVIEILTMNGTSAVTTANQYLGVNRVSIYLAGSSQGNVGTINVNETTSADFQAQMPSGEGTTEQCIFHVPSGDTFLTDWLYINVNKVGGSSPVVTVRGWVYSAVANAKFQVFKSIIDTAVENTIELRPAQPFVIGEKSSFWFTAETTTNNTVVSLRFSGILSDLNEK